MASIRGPADLRRVAAENEWLRELLGKIAENLDELAQGHAEAELLKRKLASRAAVIRQRLREGPPAR